MVTKIYENKKDKVVAILRNKSIEYFFTNKTGYKKYMLKTIKEYQSEIEMLEGGMFKQIKIKGDKI